MKIPKQSQLSLSIFLCICFFFSVTSAQHKTIEDFINQAAEEIVPANFAYYNLVDSSFTPKFDQYSFEEGEFKQMLAQYPDFPVDSFLRQVEKTSLVDWKNFTLTRAKLYPMQAAPTLDAGGRFFKTVSYDTPKETIDSLNNSKPHIAVYVPVRKRWSNKRIEKACNKAYEQYVNSIPQEDRVCFDFSTPLFVGDYALVSLNKTGRGATYIFKKVNGSWDKIFVFERWVV